MKYDFFFSFLRIESLKSLIWTWMYLELYILCFNEIESLCEIKQYNTK